MARNQRAAGTAVSRGLAALAILAVGLMALGRASAPSIVTAQVATKLAFVAQPSNTSVDTLITPGVQVVTQDASGNTVPTSFSIFLSLGANPGGSLSGTTIVTAVSGVATFSKLHIDRPGNGYTLVASVAASPPLTAATSAPFNITPGGATKLVLTTQPRDPRAEDPLPAPGVSVEVQDAMGKRVFTFSRTITLTIGANPGGGTLSGTTTATTEEGVAGFFGLSIDKPGNGYTLVATSPGLTSATSAPFNVIPVIFRVRSVTRTSCPNAAGEMGVSITTSGTALVPGTTLSFNGVPATNVTVVSSTLITATTAAIGDTFTLGIAIPGSVTLFFRVDMWADGPELYSLTPILGPTAGGTVVTITGRLVRSAGAVCFGDTAATSVTVTGGFVTAPPGLVTEHPAAHSSVVGFGGFHSAIASVSHVASLSAGPHDVPASAANPSSIITAVTPPHAAGMVNVVVFGSSSSFHRGSPPGSRFTFWPGGGTPGPVVFGKVTLQGRPATATDPIHFTPHSFVALPPPLPPPSPPGHAAFQSVHGPPPTPPVTPPAHTASQSTQGPPAQGPPHTADLSTAGFTPPSQVGHSIGTVTVSQGGVTVGVNKDGLFQFPTAPAGTYTLTASAPGYVSRQRTNVVVASSPVIVPSVRLRCGLVNDDNVVNIHDITATVASFGRTLANRVDAQGRFVDQNGDGFVNIHDITCVVSGFGTTSPEPWP